MSEKSAKISPFNKHKFFLELTTKSGERQFAIIMEWNSNVRSLKYLPTKKSRIERCLHKAPGNEHENRIFEREIFHFIGKSFCDAMQFSRYSLPVMKDGLMLLQRNNIMDFLVIGNQ